MREDIMLKSCPFCGGKPEVEIGSDGARIKCSVCESSTKYFNDTMPSFALGGRGNLNDFRIARRGVYGIERACEIWNQRD